MGFQTRRAAIFIILDGLLCFLEKGT